MEFLKLSKNCDPELAQVLTCQFQISHNSGPQAWRQPIPQEAVFPLIIAPFIHRINHSMLENYKVIYKGDL